MHVVLIAPGYEPATGGVETHVAGVARSLVKAAIPVEVWVPDRDAARPSSEEMSGVMVRRFPCSRSIRFPLSPSLYPYARHHLDGSSVIHVHGFHNAAAAAVLTRSAVPFVFTPHFHGGGHTRLARIAHLPYRPIGNRLFGRAHTVIAVSHAERQLIVRAFPALRPAVIHNGVDAAEIAAARPIGDQPPTLLVLGRLEAYKRVDLVLAAFDAAQEPGQLVIIGDGPDQARLSEITRRLGRHADVRFLGRIPRSEVHSWLRTARGVISMSEREAFGLAALEAAAGGASAVLSELPAHREVAAMASDGVIRITSSIRGLSHDLDSLLRRPNQGRRPIRDWSDVAADHLPIYREIDASSRRPRDHKS